MIDTGRFLCEGNMNMQRRFRAFLCITAIAAEIGIPGFAFAAKNIQGSPKVINLFLNWQMRDEDLPSLARWDAVVLDADQQARYPDKVRKLRELNPAIKIFAYLPSEEIAQARYSEPSDYPFAKLASHIQDAWLIKNPSGAQAFFWPGSSLLNVTDRGPAGPTGERWNEYFPRFLHDEILSSGLWDGIFFDNTFDGISHFAKGPIDLDRDGQADAAATADAAWRDGMKKMLRNVRQLNPNAILIGNGGTAYADQLNGAFLEHFPSWSWGPNWKDFRDAIGKNPKPSYTSINVNTDNQDRQNDYRLMRYGLASAVIGDGYYSFDKGDWNHDVIWWYDEYETPIGSPRAAPRNVAVAPGGAGVWSRSFEQGMALVNSTDKTQRVTLPGVFEKLHGSQDPQTNNGSLVTNLDVPAKDGVLLIRRSEAGEILGSAFQNGTFVRQYDADGKQKQNGFFAQRADAPGGATVVAADLTGNGGDDLVVADKGAVTVQFGSGRAPVTFRPYGTAYKGKIFLAVGNTNGDPAKEIIVGREGAPPEVRVYSMLGKLLARWNAYNPAFPGGVRVAIGDLDNDGKREIVTSAGPGGGPHVRIWKTDGQVWGGGFFAFDASETGGVSVAVGDVDGDHALEIIVGSGQGAAPRVRIFDFRGTLKKEIVLGSAPVAGGIQIAASDVDGDGKAEILVSGLPAF